MISTATLLEDAPKNLTIEDALIKCYTEIKNYDKIPVSISGGSDSDDMLDLIIRCGGQEKTRFVFFNTGLEYQATKSHLQYLNEKYGITIEVIPPVKPIPICVKEYGVPFWSKYVSEMMDRLQRHNFQWEDEPLEVLVKKYPRCKAALRWWCNDFLKSDGSSGSFNIDYVKGLKEFIIQNPPDFKISNRCCYYAKKLPAKKFLKENDCDLNCVGVRKAEGGARAMRYSTCFDHTPAGPNNYRPLFWFTDEDKAIYDNHYGIEHSDCYKVWGMKRTGCAGCPFGRKFEEELKLAEQYEPKFYRAMMNLFGPSYEYRRKFEEFRRKRKMEGSTNEN